MRLRLEIRQYRRSYVACLLFFSIYDVVTWVKPAQKYALALCILLLKHFQTYSITIQLIKSEGKIDKVLPFHILHQPYHNLVAVMCRLALILSLHCFFHSSQFTGTHGILSNYYYQRLRGGIISVLEDSSFRLRLVSSFLTYWWVAVWLMVLINAFHMRRSCASCTKRRDLSRASCLAWPIGSLWRARLGYMLVFDRGMFETWAAGGSIGPSWV